ncbi:hypothetical protein GCM10009626_20360 [Brachybacterium sacelli]
MRVELGVERPADKAMRRKVSVMRGDLFQERMRGGSAGVECRGGAPDCLLRTDVVVGIGPDAAILVGGPPWAGPQRRESSARRPVQLSPVSNL